MSNNYGPGVSRVLSPTGTQFVDVIFQQGRPPLDAEFTLLQDIAQDLSRNVVLRGTPSGWLGNETNLTADFQTDPDWSNWFKFGRQNTGEQHAVMWANVNGWVIPVTGTKTGTPPGSPNDTDTWNKITLDPPPANSGDTRIDFAFLEVWLARVPPNPSTLNKPSASAIYYLGNVEGGHSYITDDITDPAIGEETTQRIQVQYRIRVVKGLVGFTSYPDGFDPAVVKGQGAVASPTAYTFANMRQALGDPGLWRAGDGSGTAQTALGTVDGFSYAIPIAAIFRRNGVTWMGDPSPNLNGAFNRNPLALDRSAATTFTGVPTLAADLSDVALSATLVASAGLPLPLNPATPVLIRIGDELLTYSAIAGTTMTLTARGVYSGRPEVHKAGATIQVLSGRPDGLFADQIAKTDILDLRHAVNPNGFDYTSVLKTNLYKLLKGQLHANWKRTGAAGPQGPFNIYQDKVVALAGGVALGVTRLDGPDNIRTVFSDAAVPQKIDFVIAPLAAPGSVSVAWALNLTVNQTIQVAPSSFGPGDELRIPVAQFKAGLPGGDADQIRFLNDALTNIVTIRIDGQPDPVPASLYTVTPTNPTPSDDLIITLDADFPVVLAPKQVHITAHVQYGPGRGVARRPDSFHSAAFLSPSPDMLVRPTGVPESYLPMHISWAPTWSKFRNNVFKGTIPVTTECYADLGSKTTAFTPFRRLAMPVSFRAMDGGGANPYGAAVVTGVATGSADGTVTFTDATKNFGIWGLVAGDALVITNGFAPGRYTIATTPVGGDNFLTLSRPVFGGTIPPAVGLSYSVYKAQGLMPLLKQDGVTPKWTTTDPLGIFSGTTDALSERRDIYTTLPRDLVPGWGEYHVPILWADTSPFSEGINYMSLSVKGAGPFTNGNQNYVSYASGIDTFSTFSTYNNNPAPGPAGYNTAWTDAGSGKKLAGLRKFTDSRQLGRQGLEMPPFYGIARLFAVYEAVDFYTNGSSYDPTTRAFVAGNAKNLLRQNVSGPTFWVEIDDDGDSTFILNADCIDIQKSPNPIASFAAGDYVVEANIFGFDRGSFDLTQDFRLVLTRERATSQANDPALRSNNVSPTGTNNVIAGPTSVLPAPLTAADSVVLQYSRTPYQGDAWGSQTTYTDISQHVGPLSSGTAYQIASTQINLSALTRPNQKTLEVLASMTFSTTLGTGRISGDPQVAPVYDIREVGYEDPAAYPPVSGVAPRPRTLASDFTGDTALPAVGTELLGCTERLPLGSLMRDKDFRGGSLTSPALGTFRYNGSAYDGFLASLAVSSSLEQSGAVVDSASMASGTPGNVIVHVDGEQGNYALLVNFRTLRGGSAFSGSGRYQGGEVYNASDAVESPAGHTNVLNGLACLVRNAVTSVGATEVSAGDELMLLIITTAARLTTMDPTAALAAIGTNGSFEGYSAADLYRIEGHPLVNNNVRASLDPSTVVLTRRAF